MLRISISMPAQLTHYLLCKAVDHGSVYWLRDYAVRYQWAETNDTRLVSVHIGAPYGGAECDVPAKHSRIGASRIARALEIMLTSESAPRAERAGRVITGNFDNQDADVVLQFAAFGEVIYG